MFRSDFKGDSSKEFRWIIKDRDDKTFKINKSPQRLNLSEAVNWINSNRPTPFLGSAFSIPAPSRLPSGIQLSRVLFESLCPNVSAGSDKDDLFSKFLLRWPLERLIDLSRTVGLGHEEILLEWCRARASTAAPNALHYSIGRYVIKHGIRQIDTTNWDSLIELALEKLEIPCAAKNVSELYDYEKSPELLSINNEVIVNHCHGNFQSGDVVCSQREEETMPSKFGRHNESHLFLGYSGYEPSMYSFLINAGDRAALWCVYKEEELNNPLKKRICCGANTYVFVGDMRDLLKEIGGLNEDVDMKVTDVMGLGIALKLDEKRACLTESIIKPTIKPVSIYELLESLNLSETAGEFILRVAFVSRYIGYQIRAENPDVSIDHAIEILMTNSHSVLRSSCVWDELVLWHIARSFRRDGSITAKQLSELERIWMTPVETFGSVQSVVKMQALGYGAVMAPGFQDCDPEKPVYGYAESLGDTELVADLAELYARSIIGSQTARAVAILHTVAGRYFMSGNLDAGLRVSQFLDRYC